MRQALLPRRILRYSAPAALTLLLAACAGTVVDDPTPGATAAVTSDSTAATAASSTTASPDLLGFPASHSICNSFDDDVFGSDSGAVCAHATGPTCPDRVDTWDDLIALDFLDVISADCRFGHWSDGSLLTSSDVANYLNGLLAYTLTFLGCPIPGSGVNPLSYGLIPAALASDTFTTADLNALSAAYVAGIEQMLTDIGAPALTPAQTLAIRAKLALLQLTVKKVVVSTKYTFSTCAP
ncbi:MAG TPA: hypothetical protein VGM06_24970 [Polyangiaceae bacterium]|jgi:hypothetical protein